MARPAWDPGAAGRKPQRPRVPISQQGSDVLAPIREWWHEWRPESLWPSDVVEKFLGEPAYRTMRREGSPPERFRENLKAQSEYELFSLLDTLKPEDRDYVIHRVSDRFWSGPIHVNKMAQRISSEALSLPPDMRDKAVQRILDEEESHIYEGAGKTLWDPLTWASFLPLGSWAKAGAGRVIGKLPGGPAVKEKIMGQVPRIAEAFKWARPLKPIASMIDEVVRVAMGWSDEALRYKVMAENLKPEIVESYCDALGLPEEEKQKYLQLAEEMLEYYKDPRGLWAHYRDVRKKQATSPTAKKEQGPASMGDWRRLWGDLMRAIQGVSR